MIAHLKKNVFQIVLFEPEIPSNTGNIIRLSACLNTTLHLIHPLGFNFEDKHLKRAGLDYHELTSIIHHNNIFDFFEIYSCSRIFALSTKAEKSFWDISYQENDIFIFGPESRGLPPFILEKLKSTLIKIPMSNTVRSLNLANSVAITAYEAARQLHSKAF